MGITCTKNNDFSSLENIFGGHKQRIFGNLKKIHYVIYSLMFLMEGFITTMQVVQ